MIPGSCDFVVWFLLADLQSRPRKDTNIKPIHTKSRRSDESSMLLPLKGRAKFKRPLRGED